MVKISTMHVAGELNGKRVLVTAGPTREAIDPVRYISNHSSGKMGYSIASAFLRRGATVILVVGPVDLRLGAERLQVVPVISAGQMLEACRPYFQEVDIAIFCAAVADYRPAEVAEQKIRKDDDELVVKLVKNKDIAYEFGRQKATWQYAVGFALETHDEREHALAKMQRKGMDMVVLNSMNDAGAGFGGDTNKITILTKGGGEMRFPLKPKEAVAEDILEAIQRDYLINLTTREYAR
jgi:phosphopantothenoylcysteine decarboxylase / phosphopantothenate---cysteine ligase